MSQENNTLTWDHLGDEVVKETSRRIQIPDRVFERGILRKETERPDGSDIGKAHWHFDTATGWVIISDRPLDQSIKTQEGRLIEGGVETIRYKTPNGTSLTKPLGENNSNQLTIPAKFFDSSAEGVPDAVRFSDQEYRHFVTADEFLSDTPTPTKSCYLLRTDQLNSILQNEYHPGGDDTPQFI
jgi:hypothetical protein